MRVEDILSPLAMRSIASSHALRRRSLFVGVQALIDGGRLGLTALGRSLFGAVAPKHCIKRIDRLLGNSRLHAEAGMYFGAVAKTLLAGQSERPIILVDWTRLDDAFAALVAAVPTDGRALVIYAEVHSLSKWKNRAVERGFLNGLNAALPPGDIPIIVTDSGYQNPWFRAVEAMGWSFVGRLSGSVTLRDDGAISRVDAQYALAGRYPKSLGWVGVARAPAQVRMHVVPGARFKRKPHRRRRNPHLYSQGGKNCKKRAMEPWVLGSNLDLSSEEIIDLYALRMQIEESFRDAKNHRFGWGLDDVFVRSAKRYEVLLLIAAFATLVVTAIGRRAELAGCHLGYQANTVKNRRVLSLFYLGKELLRRWEWEAIPDIERLRDGQYAWNIKTIPGDP